LTVQVGELAREYADDLGAVECGDALGIEVYVKATPQLLELASCRFEDRLRRARRPR
jgi:hypothetical protein